jgi:toxin ParE1/3/4
MAYLVDISGRAQRDLPRIYARIDAGNSDAALKRYRAFRQAILSLEELPNRCPVTPENRKLRHLLHGSKPHVYRAIFSVNESRKQVEVIHIRQGARDAFTGPDVA